MRKFHYIYTKQFDCYLSCFLFSFFLFHHYQLWESKTWLSFCIKRNTEYFNSAFAFLPISEVDTLKILSNSINRVNLYYKLYHILPYCVPLLILSLLLFFYYFWCNSVYQECWGNPFWSQLFHMKHYRSH